MVEYLTVATINRAHGLKGEVEISLETDFPERFKPGTEFWLLPPLPDRRIVTITSTRPVKNEKLLVKFAGVDDRTAAEALGRRRLAVPPEQAPELPPNTYWRHDLIGLTVVTTNARRLGTIAEILETPAHDVYVVRNGGEYLIPATAEVVKSVDLERGEMLIEPMPGLIDEADGGRDE